MELGHPEFYSALSSSTKYFYESNINKNEILIIKSRVVLLLLCWNGVLASSQSREIIKLKRSVLCLTRVNCEHLLVIHGHIKQRRFTGTLPNTCNNLSSITQGQRAMEMSKGGRNFSKQTVLRN